MTGFKLNAKRTLYLQATTAGQYIIFFLIKKNLGNNLRTINKYILNKKKQKKSFSNYEIKFILTFYRFLPSQKMDGPLVKRDYRFPFYIILKEQANQLDLKVSLILSEKYIIDRAMNINTTKREKCLKQTNGCTGCT